MELHDGYLRFLGTFRASDGSTLPGSIDLYLGAQDGQLTARIAAVDIAGISMDDARVSVINQEIDVQYSHPSISMGADVRFEEVEVTEEALNLTVHVTVRF